MKYGTRQQVSEKLIAEIENTKPPGVNTIIIIIVGRNTSGRKVRTTDLA